MGDWFAERVPEVELLYREHLDSWGEFLPHLFFGTELAEFFKSRVQEHGCNDELVVRFLDAVEELATNAHPEAAEVIQVSFLEWFVLGGDEDKAVIAECEPVLGPTSREMVEALKEGHQ